MCRKYGTSHFLFACNTQGVFRVILVKREIQDASPWGEVARPVRGRMSLPLLPANGLVSRGRPHPVSGREPRAASPKGKPLQRKGASNHEKTHRPYHRCPVRRRTAGGLRGEASAAEKTAGTTPPRSAAQRATITTAPQAGVNSGLVPRRTPPGPPPTRPHRKLFTTPVFSMESTDFDTAREALMTAVEITAHGWNPQAYTAPRRP